MKNRPPIGPESAPETGPKTTSKIAPESRRNRLLAGAKNATFQRSGGGLGTVPAGTVQVPENTG